MLTDPSLNTAEAEIEVSNYKVINYMSVINKSMKVNIKIQKANTL